MNLDEIYKDKKVGNQSKSSLLKLLNALQLFGSIFELYTVGAVSTGQKLISSIEKINNKKKNKI